MSSKAWALGYFLLFKPAGWHYTCSKLYSISSWSTGLKECMWE